MFFYIQGGFPHCFDLVGHWLFGQMVVFDEADLLLDYGSQSSDVQAWLVVAAMGNRSCVFLMDVNVIRFELYYIYSLYYTHVAQEHSLFDDD